MKVLLLTRYSRLGASSRLRYFQYLSYLESQGISVDAAELFGDSYIHSLMKNGRRSLLSVVSAYLRRILWLLRLHRYDLIWVQCEALPWLPYWIEGLFLNGKIHYVVEYDDAIFHRYDMHSRSWIRQLLGNKIPALMQRSRVVIVGNDYLADFAAKAGSARVVYLPTAIDLDRYVPRLKSNDDFVIGWIGSPITAPYLKLISPALIRLAESGPVKFVVVGAEAPRLNGVDSVSVPWSEEDEVSQICNFDVGVMPLPDEPWERGKCGYKLIQYMACGKPVVASPVGINTTIVEPAINGFLANSVDEWVIALEKLRRDKELCFTMGQAGRDIVEKKYCIQVTAPQLAAILRSAANK